jgi:hypothetical protein
VIGASIFGVQLPQVLYFLSFKFQKMDTFKIYHDTNHFEIIDLVNQCLRSKNIDISFEFVDGEFDGYDIVEVKELK